METLRDLIRDHDPDIILLSETTPRWLDELEGLEDDYPHTLFQPQENHFGMLLYSKLELKNPEIRFLFEPGIPSVRTEVRLRSGTFVTLYGVHPRPPGLEMPGGKVGVVPIGPVSVFGIVSFSWPQSESRRSNKKKLKKNER